MTRENVGWEIWKFQPGQKPAPMMAHDAEGPAFEMCDQMNDDRRVGDLHEFVVLKVIAVRTPVRRARRITPPMALPSLSV